MRLPDNQNRPRAIRVIAMTVALALPAAIPAGCACCPRSSDSALAPRPASINHYVFFRLKNPADARELIHDCDAMLHDLPGLVSYAAGTRLDVGRTNVQTDFDVGFYVGFDTIDAYREYVNHPKHVELVQKWKSRWESIRIFDVDDPSP